MTDLKVKGHVGIVRDSFSGAIISTDEQAYRSRIVMKQRDYEMSKILQELAELRQEVKNLKRDQQ